MVVAREQWRPVLVAVTAVDCGGGVGRSVTQQCYP